MAGDLGLVAILVREAVERAGGAILSAESGVSNGLKSMTHWELVDALQAVLDETGTRIAIERVEARQPDPRGQCEARSDDR